MLPPPPVLAGLFRTDDRARAAYAEGAGIYRIVPAAVCRPAAVDDLRALVEWAEARGVALVPRGAGSAMGGGNVGDGVVVDLTALHGPGVELDVARRGARTGAATTLGALQKAAAPHGLRLPPDPSSWRWATVGGVVSTNASGARTVRYGSVRQWVEALTLVTTGGEICELHRGVPPGRPAAHLPAMFERAVAPAIRAAADEIESRFPPTRKNSSGYALDAWLASGDLLDLVIGAEGTLGFVTEVKWRLDPTPAHRAALRVTLPDLDAIARAVAALMPFAPSALELLDRTFLDLVARGPLPDDLRRLLGAAGAILLVELEGDDPAALAGATARAARAVTAAPAASAAAIAVESALGDTDAERLWALRHAASPILAGLSEERRSLQVIEDACVPVERIGEYVRAVRAAAARQRLDVVIFGHAGDGNVHVNLLPELARADWQKAVAALLEEVTEAVLRLDGTTTGEHGDGRLRAGFVERRYGPAVTALFRRVKTAFDPHGIFNPGIILPDGTPPISRLKVGSGAVGLPNDIAAGLRAIERGAGYGRSRLELADATTS